MKHILYCTIISCICLFACKQEKQFVAFNRNIPVHNDSFKLADDITQQIEAVFHVKVLQKEAYAPVFWDFYDRTHIPNFSVTDINNDGLLDYAMLVASNATVKLAIAYSHAKKYQYWLSNFSIEPITHTGIVSNLAIMPAGRRDIVRKKDTSLVLPTNGFLIQQLELAYKIVYYNEDTIQYFTIQE